MASHSHLLAWRIPWAEEPVGYSSQGHKESDTTEVTWHSFTDACNWFTMPFSRNEHNMIKQNSIPIWKKYKWGCRQDCALWWLAERANGRSVIRGTKVPFRDLMQPPPWSVEGPRRDCSGGAGLSEVVSQQSLTGLCHGKAVLRAHPQGSAIVSVIPSFFTQIWGLARGTN